MAGDLAAKLVDERAERAYAGMTAVSLAFDAVRQARQAPGGSRPITAEVYGMVSRMTLDPVAWRNSRPRKRMGAGVLVRDSAGRVLVVEPTYKATWEIPGGSVEADESPRAACAREVAEELGLGLEVGRLLCIEWQGSEPDRSESVMLIYDGGVFPAGLDMRLAADELRSARFVEAAELDRLMVPRLARRVRVALAAVEQNVVVELEHGVLAPATPSWASR